MASLINRKRVLLSKIESSYGADPTPTGSANAILVRNLNMTPVENDLAARDLIRSYLGNSEQIPAACYNMIDFEVELAGPGSAGTAPAWGPLMRACGFSETTLASASTGTASAGGASTITLAGGASAVDDAYNGLEIRTTGGTGSGQRRLIKDYVGSTKVVTVHEAWGTTPDNTTTYSIDAQVSYRPVSSSFESVANYFNLDGVLHKMLGVRGSVSLELPNKQIPVLKFKKLGLYSTPTDTSAPTPIYTGFSTPVAVNNVNTSPLRFHGIDTAVMSSLTIDMANANVFRSLVGGSEQVLITDRKPAGDITIEATTVAVRDWWTRAKAVTLGSLGITHGQTSGNIVAVYAPYTQITKPGYEDLDGVAMLKMGLILTPSEGNDEIAIIVK